jgi:hypothetical protein
MSGTAEDSKPNIYMGDFIVGGNKIPECDIRSWVPHSASVGGIHFDQALLTRAQKVLKEWRICLVLGPSKYPQLYQGFVDDLLKEESKTTDLVQASYNTEALAEFRTGLTLNLPTLLRGLPPTVTNRSVVVDIMEVGALHRPLFDSIIDDSHPVALDRLARDLRARNLRLLFIADKALLSRPATAAGVVCEVDSLSAARNEILTAHAVKGLSANRIDRIVTEKLIGDDPIAIAEYLHGLHVEGKLLETIIRLEEELKSGDPRQKWAEDTGGKLFPVTNESIFKVRDKRTIVHNEALIEVGRITAFLFSLFESLTLEEFETLFNIVVAGEDSIEKVDLEYYEVGDDSGQPPAPGTLGEKARYRITASLLAEYKQARDSLFRELSIRRSQQTARYAFALPYMREEAVALLAEQLPIGPHRWFNRLVIDTPTLFSSNDHIARRLIECYADWLSVQPPENVREFSLVGWWSLAAQIAQLGYQKATEGIEDKGLLVVVGFLSEQAAIHSFVSRVCLFFQSLMSRPSLEYLVPQALNDLINKRGWKIALGVCRTLQTEPRFDVFKWIVQLVDRGDAATREEAAWLLSRYVERAFRERKNADEILSRIEGHLPAAGEPPRPSQLVAYSFIQRLVFEKSSRMKQNDYKVGGLLHLSSFTTKGEALESLRRE